MFAYATDWERTPPSGGSSTRSAATPSTTYSTCERPTTSAAARHQRRGTRRASGRVADQLAAHVAADDRDLAIHGDDLIAELGLAPGPAIGRILDALLDRVIADSTFNDRTKAIELARAMNEHGA